MSDIDKIAIVILAAGESSRMKQPKQLLPWGETTLLGNAIHMAKESDSEEVFVVLGAAAEKIQSQLNSLNVSWIFNKYWSEGMGTSIASAMQHILSSGNVFSGILFMLCDQPFINTLYLNKIINTFRNSDKGIIATAYNKNSGVPAVFHHKYFEGLSNLSGTDGAKKIIANNANDVFDIYPKGLAKDLDTFEEYEQALKSNT